MAHKADKHLGTLLSLPVLFMLVAMGFAPLFFPTLAQYEGSFFPVVKNVQVVERENTPTGLIVDVHFDKVRSCEFLGVSWYDSFGDRAPIIFDLNDEGNLPLSRPVMDDQNAGPWKLIGVDRLDGSVAITSHRCHPLWITFTRFYP